MIYVYKTFTRNCWIWSNKARLSPQIDCLSDDFCLQSLMLQVAKDLLEAESKEKVQERERYMEEHCPPLCLPICKEELQVKFMVTFSLGLKDFKLFF